MSLNRSRRRRYLVARLMVLLVLLPLTAPLFARPASAQQRRIGAVVAPVRLVPRSDDPIAVSGLHRYFGRIELKGASDGLVVVNRLPLERYLLGLAEVPSIWPLEAQKAQAVAARTYALRNLRRPRAGAAATYGFDICATVQCQVYSGADHLRAARLGDRWRRAVEETAHEAVLYEGEPILARYHSTSGGRTFANEQIFPSEGSYPYLQGVESESEEASPLYQWNVTFTLGLLTRILRRTDVLPRGAGRLTEVRTVPSSTGRHYPDVRLEARRRTLTVTAEELRVAVRGAAPDLFPGRYPSPAATAGGRLPETFPSNRLEIRTEGRDVRVTGRGWGHGVGMSQWGAEGMARRGASYEEILTHYYTDVEVGRFHDPGSIDVGVDWGRSEVAASGDFEIRDGRGRTVVRHALGRWSFRQAGDGAITIRPPRGHGLPLTVGIVDHPALVEPGERVALTVALSRPARVRARTAGHQGGPAAQIRRAGRRNVPWSAPGEPGTYTVRVTASTPRNRTVDEVEVEVARPPPRPSPTPQSLAAESAGPEHPDDPSFLAGVALALLGLVTIATLGLLVGTIRR